MKISKRTEPETRLCVLEVIRQNKTLLASEILRKSNIPFFKFQEIMKDFLDHNFVEKETIDHSGRHSAFTREIYKLTPKAHELLKVLRCE